jgi:hypothetical protein
VVVGARRAQPFERGEEGMMRGMRCGGGGRSVAPFYRVREVGRGGGAVQETAGGGGALSRHRLLEGETTGQRRFMGKLKRRRRCIFSFFHLALEGDKWRREGWRRLGGLKVEEEPGWVDWAERPDDSGRKGKFQEKEKKLNGLPGNFGSDWKRASSGGNKEKRKWAAQEMWAKIEGGLQKIPFQILNQGFEFK